MARALLLTEGATALSRRLGPTTGPQMASQGVETLACFAFRGSFPWTRRWSLGRPIWQRDFAWGRMPGSARGNGGDE
jgi:hypothetical protein